MRLDLRDKFPSGMENYLGIYGWHFSKKMAEWAISKMYKKSLDGKRESISPISKSKIEELLKTYNIHLENDEGYDCLYVANMCKADFLNSSIIDEAHLIKFVKDYIDDPDGYDEMPFTRFYADCIGSGILIPWEDVI